jgi:hypothetical protein
VDFWGFYDGEQTWRLRFMPDQLGLWRYVARFSDGSLGVAGTFTCVESDVPGMLSVDESNPLWFGLKGGKHTLIRSFHVGDGFFASNMPDAKREAFLDWAQAQGYTMLSVASHYLNRDADGRGRGWDTPKLWPLDAMEFRKLERLLDDLAARKMMVFPFAGFFGRDAYYPSNPAEQELYVRYVLARLGPYWNVLFNVAGPEPLHPKAPFMPHEKLCWLGALIKSLDVFGHLLTVHNATGEDAFKDEAWSDFGTLQGPKTVDLDELSAGLRKNHHPAKPLYAQETLWSGNKWHPDYTDEQLRKNTYVLMLSVAALNFADNGGPEPGAVGLSSSGFSGSLDLADCHQWRHDIIKRVWDFFETIPFYRMSPQQHLVSTGCCDNSSYCLAEIGVQYLVYLPSGGPIDVQIVNGPYTVTWINAENTQEQFVGGVTYDGQGLQSPPDGDDWLCYLRKTTEII